MTNTNVVDTGEDLTPNFEENSQFPKMEKAKKWANYLSNPFFQLATLSMTYICII
jgi:hypothetical protein